MHNNHVKTDFKEFFFSIDRNILRYFSVYLHTRYLGNVHQKLYNLFHIIHKHFGQITSKSDYFCDRCCALHRQAEIKTPKTSAIIENRSNNQIEDSN